ncbi:protein IQ-DOMAIN 17-like isoform X2 [Argentina anserina]|uniref:protein IQ-DOMAIN 17-like isoform X2 n=1 Tax=Argentina anserina TaxID=57926 RepID=UPI00217665C5|nr:protein IQ-DOMAIN 17-like isoform X2 [Potentilla anserina]
MGKKGGSSWLTAVKRAFRSPTKDDEDHKKREKRRWIFRKPTNLSQESPKEKTESVSVAAAEQRHALDVAVATAEAAMATAQAAAVEVARLTRPTNHSREQLQFAAIVVQTAFRGYLARRARRALKGLVKLQALVRGHNVRKQAKMTLRCMQALVRVQARVLDQRTRLSHEGSRKSAFSDTNSNSAWESRYVQDISDRKSISREGSSIADDWDERHHTIEEVKAMLQHRKEAAMKREKALSHAFSQQIWRNGRSPSMGNEDELEEKPKWLDRWMAPKPWESSRGRASTDQRDPIKTVEMDTSQPYSSLSSNFRRSNASQYHQQNQQQRPTSPLLRDRSHQNQHQRPSSPLNRDRSHQYQHFHHSPITPSPSKSRPPLQVRSASPRCVREDRSSTTSQTPSLKSNYYYNGGVVHQHSRGSTSTSGGNAGATLPNYMAATESAKARIRSQSAPRQRPSTPDRERVGGVGSVKKRLSFPAPDPYGAVGMGGYGHSLRSPSFKSVVSGSNFGLEQQSNYSSCCTESHGGEVSPSSTSDLRRWLR